MHYHFKNDGHLEPIYLSDELDFDHDYGKIGNNHHEAAHLVINRTDTNRLYFNLTLGDELDLVHVISH